jgi:subtilisin family serine protease
MGRRYPVSGGARTIAWDVSTVDADEVWDEGYTGEGVLVAVLDSGVNYNHVDLADQYVGRWRELPLPRIRLL